MLATKIDIESPLPLDDTRKRLLVGLVENPLLQGTVRGNRVVIRRHDNEEWAGLSPVFRGRLVTDGGPVRLRGRVGFPWAGELIAAGLVLLVSSRVLGLVEGSALSALFVALVHVVGPAFYHRETRRDIAAALRGMLERPGADAARRAG